MTNLSNASALLLPEIDLAISAALEDAKIEGDPSLFTMLRYHMGWEDETTASAPQGKRIRPLLLLLVSDAVGGKWRPTLPAAAAIEILHNFSLIHDDIEDNSDTRRGRQTLWKTHGVPLSLNAGDAMFALVFHTLKRLSASFSPRTCLGVNEITASACLHLTKGQHLDISFEERSMVSIPNYLQMVTGKTAALLAASARIGALLGGASPEAQTSYHQLGLNLGLAFQMHDDILGIWGDPGLTGKSAATDLLTRKKNLPILFGLENSPEFKKAWSAEITPANAVDLASLLKKTGAYEFTVSQAERYTNLALSAYQSSNSSGSFAPALTELIHYLIQRKH